MASNEQNTVDGVTSNEPDLNEGDMTEEPEESGMCAGGGSAAAWSLWSNVSNLSKSSLGGLIDVAKQTSSNALDFMRKDLQEFTCTMQKDTSYIATTVKTGVETGLKQENAASAKERVKKGMSSIIGGLQRVVFIPPDSDEETETIVPASHVFDRAKARLHAIQVDQGTYCNEPDGPKEKFEEFINHFDLEGNKGVISELLVSNVEVRSIYTKLVPSTVSHVDFWQRYFYKVEQLNEDEMRRQELMKRADEAQQDEGDLAWDDDEWGDAETAGASVQDKPLSISPGNEKLIKATLESFDSGSQIEVDEQTATKILEEEFSQEAPSPGPAAKDAVLKNQASTVAVNKDDEGSASEDKMAVPAPDVAPVIINAEVHIDSAAASSASYEEIPESSQSFGDSGGSASAGAPADGNISIPTVQPTEPVQPQDASGAQPAKEPLKIRTKEKDDMVVYSPGSGSEGASSSPGSGSTNQKESLDSEEWEKDFDIEVTEDDLRLAQEAAAGVAAGEGEAREEQDEDWENWE